eukprot:4137564-Amphidinium_carterae.1
MIKDGVPPVTDFAVFGPYASRISRRVKFSGLMYDAEGLLKRGEINGPESFARWYDCFQVWRSCLIMLDAADPATVDAYGEKIRELSTRVGMECWGLLYLGEVRCRREHFARIMRDGHGQHQAGVQHGFETSRPWNFVIRAASEDMSFWSKEVLEPCINDSWHARVLHLCTT